jgi:hypothetical protein
VNGVSTATAYALLFTHQQVVHTFGTIACIVYVVDRVRIAYPEVVARRAPWVNRFLVRAEEEVRESAMIPYAIAVLLTILSVPKPAALIAIYTSPSRTRWPPSSASASKRIARNRPSRARRVLRHALAIAALVLGEARTRRAHHRRDRVHHRLQGGSLQLLRSASTTT